MNIGQPYLIIDDVDKCGYIIRDVTVFGQTYRVLADCVKLSGKSAEYQRDFTIKQGGALIQIWTC